MKRFFGMIFPLLLSIALYSAVPLPTAQATNDAPEGLTPADWAQIQNQLAPEEITTYSQQAKLTTSDAAETDFLGYSVAVSGDTAVIGAFLDDDGGYASVFTRTDGVWSQQAKLTASDLAAGDEFGVSVAVSGDTAVIGAYLDDNGGGDSGSAYVFTRTGGVWSQQTKLIASDSAANDFFGYSVAVSGDTAVIGAYGDDNGGQAIGSAYIFTRSGGVWSQQAKLTASDSTEYNWFGGSVAVHGDTAVIGAPSDGNESTSGGSVYVFTRSGGVWSQQAKLTASDPTEDDQFGISVAISGDTAVIGAPGDDDNRDNNTGSAYLFTRSGGVWSQQAKLTASDPTEDDQFGTSVAISDNTAVIGAPGDDYKSDNIGSAYLFILSGGVWSQQAKLTANDATVGDQFGVSVAMSGNAAIIGAPWNHNGEHGGAYIFAPNPPVLQKIYQWFIQWFVIQTGG